MYLPPQVLLLHLKRFQHDGRGRLIKLDAAVKFEFELDLSPFMAENAPNSSSNSGQAAQQQQQQLMYDLVGLVVHMGTMRGGHYIAYVKRVHGGADASAEAGAAGRSAGSQGRVQWFYISDTSVRAVGVSEVAAAQAYMLLYVRRPAKQQQQEGEQGQEVPEGHLHDCGL
jgi:ubiquitin carboxyl-terminal hydrolase 16/45